MNGDCKSSLAGPLLMLLSHHQCSSSHPPCLCCVQYGQVLCNECSRILCRPKCCRCRWWLCGYNLDIAFIDYCDWCYIDSCWHNMCDWRITHRLLRFIAFLHSMIDLSSSSSNTNLCSPSHHCRRNQHEQEQEQHHHRPRLLLIKDMDRDRAHIDWI